MMPGRRGPVLRAGVSDPAADMLLSMVQYVYMAKTIRRGMQIIASGKVEWRRQSWEMPHPLCSNQGK